ncbi:unnamed protein product [Orchesella dallaii]|uniref:Odorant receptor n=1 Tax=Orchesella dallaii TaxID=48710 RepID=A0ABP1Q5X7_9HEXA
MWGALLTIQSIIQPLRPLRVIYSQETGTFYVNPAARKKLKLHLIDLNLLIIYISSGVGLHEILSQETDHLDPEAEKLQTQKAVLGAVVYVLFLGLFTCLLGISWTFKNRHNETVWMMSHAHSLHKERDSQPSGESTSQEKKEGALFSVLLYALLFVCVTGLLTVTTIPFASKNTPAHVIFTQLLPFPKDSFVFALVCAIYLGISGYFGVILVVQAFCYITAVLYEIKFVLKGGYHTVETRKDFTFKREWLAYGQATIFVREVNLFGFVFFPIIMIVGFCINVVTSLVCIKYYHQLPLPMLLVLLGFDGVTIIATLVTHNFAVVAEEESEKFKKYWTPRLVSRLQRKQGLACMPMAIQIGSFFHLKRSTLLNTINEVVNLVVTLLIV